MKKIFASMALVIGCSAFAQDTPSSLSNREIDKIFISFEQQAREEIQKELEEEKKKKALEKKKKEQAKRRATMGRQVLSHTGAPVVVGDNKFNAPPPLNTANAPINLNDPENTLIIKGIICEKECVALTNRGMLKRGTKLGNGEKVKKITKTSLKTNLRTIKL